MVRVAAVVLATLVSACFTKPPEPPAGTVEDARTDTNDVAADAEPPVGACPIRDDFTSGTSVIMGCGTWANAVASEATAQIKGDVLVHGITSGQIGDVSCISKTTVPFVAVSVTLESVLTSVNGSSELYLMFTDQTYIAVQVLSDGNAGFSWNLGSSAGSSQSLSYDPATMKHLRVARSSTGVDVRWDDDNLSNTMMHSFPMTLPMLPISVSLRTTFKDAGASSQAATFDNLDACM